MFKYVKFGVKTGIAGAAIYYTVQEGLWDDAERSEQLYKKICSTALPYIKEVPVEVPDLPKIDDMCHGAQSYWNKGIKISFSFLGDLPQHVTTWTKTGILKVSEQLQQLSSGAEEPKKN
ncbi:MICOS complex subunit MIC13 homolog QIL1 [Bacillus rossius redtenbacheri]|uniref:MICOS complex subunit MIC13 homolog QIL1 n=1 Tax=Bacillus rossius redtenbacheri TaxID=93214 RepID=UPI002FDD9829